MVEGSVLWSLLRLDESSSSEELPVELEDRPRVSLMWTLRCSDDALFLFSLSLVSRLSASLL